LLSSGEVSWLLLLLERCVHTPGTA
jgi:hypothetical protein